MSVHDVPGSLSTEKAANTCKARTGARVGCVRERKVGNRAKYKN